MPSVVPASVTDRANGGRDRQIRAHRVPHLADLVGLVGLQPVHRVAVLPWEHRHRAGAELVGAAERPHRDLPAVGDQDLAEHVVGLLA